MRSAHAFRRGRSRAHLARSPTAKANDLAKLVLTDGPLAARVLKISRSVLYARCYPPSSLEDAIVTVGFGALRKIDSASLAVRLATADRIAREIGYGSTAPCTAEDGAESVEAGEPDADTAHAALLERVTSSFEAERDSFE